MNEEARLLHYHSILASRSFQRKENHRTEIWKFGLSEFSRGDENGGVVGSYELNNAGDYTMLTTNTGFVEHDFVILNATSEPSAGGVAFSVFLREDNPDGIPYTLVEL